MVNKPSNISCLALFFCSKFVRSGEANVVVVLGRLEALLGRDSPVAVDLVLNRGVDIIVAIPGTRGRELGLVGEVVLDAAEEGDGLAHDGAGTVPVPDCLEGVLNAIFDLLVAADTDVLPGFVNAKPVERVLVVAWLVDDLWPHLLPALRPFALEADVEVVAHLNVDGGLHSHFALLVVLSNSL